MSKFNPTNQAPRPPDPTLAESTNKQPMTKQEQKVMDLLVDAHNLFIKMEQTHPSHISRWVDGIHSCQDVLIHRIVQRDYPKHFVTVPGRES